MTSAQFSEDGSIVEFDTIEYKGKFWIVTEWNEIPEAGLTKPARIICVDNLKHQKIGSGDQIEFVLNDPIPKSVLHCQDQIQLAKMGLVVIDNPDIQCETAKGIH